mmetsp:Transcript_704/g.765  ORF Transcript_704/g.765 Transcript_704/m.765 type:complete len:101 (+) Transcript_704:413-715(+)
MPVLHDFEQSLLLGPQDKLTCLQDFLIPLFFIRWLGDYLCVRQDHTDSGVWSLVIKELLIVSDYLLAFILPFGSFSFLLRFYPLLIFLLFFFNGCILSFL